MTTWCNDIIHWMNSKNTLDLFCACVSGRAHLVQPTHGMTPQAYQFYRWILSVNADLKDTHQWSLLTGASPLVAKVAEFCNDYPDDVYQFRGDAVECAEVNARMGASVRQEASTNVKSQIIDLQQLTGIAAIVTYHNTLFVGQRPEQILRHIKSQFERHKPDNVTPEAHNRQLRALLSEYWHASGGVSRMFGTVAEELAAVWKTYERNSDWQTERRIFEMQQEAMKKPVTLEATMDRIVRWINDKPATEQRIISTATTDDSKPFDTDKLIAAIQKGLRIGQQHQGPAAGTASGSNSQSNNNRNTNKKVDNWHDYAEQ